MSLDPDTPGTADQDGAEPPRGGARHALVTGGAGFIGSHLVDRLLEGGWTVTVVDNFDPFYDPALKRANVEAHVGHPRFHLIEADIRDEETLRTLLTGSYDVVVHLAAKAGVRPSIEHPTEYQAVNVQGTQVLLELAREWGTSQFVFASSSSVYGVSPDVPWQEGEAGLRPISPYAATKVAGELLGHTYAHLYGIRFVALRFFTVYGPRQRPDLAIQKFAQGMLSGHPIPLYGDGSTCRDYTFVEDIVDGVVAAMRYEGSGYEVINLGNNRTISLSELVAALERVLGKEARVERLPIQAGDVPQTWADISKAQRLLGYEPKVSLQEGLESYVTWLLEQPSRPSSSTSTCPRETPAS